METRETRETRAYPTANIEVRAADGSPSQIVGYAAVFNSPSEPLQEWGVTFTERIMPGAFSKTLKEADVRALVNHDANYVLGRNKAGTLTLAEDGRGLTVDIAPPDTQWARDLMTSMQRGDVNQMSFAFEVIKERWLEDNERKTVQRDLLEVKLYDVSVVTYPAYPATSALARQVWEGAGLDIAQVTSTLLRTRAGLPLSCEDGACLRSAIAVLTEHIPAEPVSDHSADFSAARRRTLDLLTASF